MNQLRLCFENSEHVSQYSLLDAKRFARHFASKLHPVSDEPHFFHKNHSDRLVGFRDPEYFYLFLDSTEGTEPQFGAGWYQLRDTKLKELEPWVLSES